MSIIKRPTKKSPLIIINRIGKIVVLLLLLCVAYSFVEPYLLEEKTTVFHSSDLPSNFIGKKIVFISDVHHDQFFSRQRIAVVVEKVNAIKPDIIILGGDYVSGEEKYIAPCFEELAKLRAPLGVYGVTGNHDSDTDYKEVVRYMKASGIIPLENAARWIKSGDQKIRLGGVKTSYGKISDAQPTIDQTQKSDLVILASHNPDFAEELTTDNIDLILSGHTHGGQVTFFGLWSPYLPSDYGMKYMKGMVQAPRTQVLVSNGVGEGFLPVRFFAAPQIETIVLEKK